ncbi:MAG: hypothetical protein K2L46_06630 [Paramuribaculum sp.]|nr:hypothetical protein [Paramuribaculum sp.]MDE6323061.1 hypothetical protein [Paramuribaculum sp.]MDE6488940.1 hypothetical protein [Paramuribaculum sp.]
MVHKYSLNELSRRRSVRKYSARPLDPETAASLDEEVGEINKSYRGIRFQLCYDSPAAFASFRKSYGLFSGVRNCLVAMTDRSVPHASEIAGFAAERFVMVATRCGLGTCFVGVTFDGAKLDVSPRQDEKILFVVSFGYEAEGNEGVLRSLMRRIVHARSLLPDDFYSARPEDLDLAHAIRKMPGLADGLKAVSVAPSARNQQPVRLRMDAGGVLRATTTVRNDFSDVDLGIAKFNFQSVVGGRWQWGDDGCFEPD